MQAQVSVIIPCYRCADTIDRAVESVISQTWLPKEILLVEDCSQDEGKTLASLYHLQQRLQDKVTIKVIPLPKNTGPGCARNAGWDEAQQPYLAFLDADDSWHPEKLEIQYKWMESHQDVDLTGHLSIFLANNVVPPTLPERLTVRSISRYVLLLSNRFPTRSVMLRRDIVNRFEPTKRYAEDYLLWLRIVLDGKSAWLMELTLAYSYKTDFGAGGLTQDLWKMECGELDTYRKIYREGSISVALYWCITLYSMLKYLRRLLFRVFN